MNMEIHFRIKAMVMKVIFASLECSSK